MVMLTDRAPLERVRKLADGRIAAVARFARSGVYQYAGTEIGRPDLQTVNVYRPESEVFDQAAMASFAHKAITVGHPDQAVTADNWKSHSAGWTEGKVARDGEFLEIPLMLADASAVRAYESGEARELSAGYECDLIWGDGVAPDGTRFQAKQTRIRGNHIAQVPAGRAGGACRLGDASQSVGDAMFNDAERAFADSDEGGLLIAQARHRHYIRNAWRGVTAPEFTDAMAAGVIRARVSMAASSAQATADSAEMRKAIHAARHSRYAKS